MTTHVFAWVADERSDCVFVDEYALTAKAITALSCRSIQGDGAASTATQSDPNPAEGYDRMTVEGDRLRVTFEGVIDSDGDFIIGQREWFIAKETLQGAHCIVPLEPAWANQPGAIAKDKHGGAWQTDDSGVWRSTRYPSGRAYCALVADFGPIALLHAPADAA